ncbi:hypothetical protein ACFO5R_13085 [Halosolutus amylolyticus]|uniref:Uncharacterized protein n=1 Tax=Halosolutus amylolyticus TaxID=2932267 RepID=A0ABD5PQU6_9EURY|nr:hypothetical protein [Halosolutus amylolyticus]
MSELTDRLAILAIAATGLLVLIVGWAGGLVEAELAGLSARLALAVLFAILALVLGGIWWEFNHTETE